MSQKKVAIMQPYLFPYLGYFQLINAVEIFVFYDDVNFIKRGWINRNQILLNGQEKLISVPLIKAFNSSILRDNVFNPKTFNPLKYDFNFNSRDLIKYYRVDNTNYLIVIHSQYQ